MKQFINNFVCKHGLPEPFETVCKHELTQVPPRPVRLSHTPSQHLSVTCALTAPVVATPVGQLAARAPMPAAVASTRRLHLWP